MNTEKELFQLRHAIDKFFGTEQGFKVVTTERTIVGAIKDVIAKVTGRCNETPNVFDELARLKIVLCGGTITSLFTNAHINDLDFYMKDPSLHKECRDFFKARFPDYEHLSTNAYTFSRKSPKSNKRWTAQLIIRFTGEPSEIFDWFDFTITHGAYDFENKEFVFGDRFFPDIAKRRLVYSGYSKYPICAMYRTKKYTERGYELPGATVMHIALSIVQLKIENYKQLKDQLMGIDTIYLQRLLEAKDPDAPVEYGEFIYEAFQLIDQITGETKAEEDDHDNN
jgi:hypothetical protein